MSVAAYLIIMWIYMLSGGLFIRNAVDYFKRHKYFRLGLSLMYLLSNVCFMIKFIFIHT